MSGGDFIERHWKAGTLTDRGRAFGRKLDIVAESRRHVALSEFLDRVDRSGNGVEEAMAMKLDVEAKRDRLFAYIQRIVGPLDCRLLRLMFLDGNSADAIAVAEGRPAQPHYYRLRIIDALNILGAQA